MAVSAVLEMELSAGVWTDKSRDIIRDPIRWRRGISGSGPTDVIAGPGWMTFSVDNTEQNIAGLAGAYSPGHANCLSGFRHGTRVRLKETDGTTERYVFRGRLKQIKPESGASGLRVTACMAEDLMADFATADAINLVLRTAVRPDELIDDLIAILPDAPANEDLDVGVDEYPFAFDDLGGSVPKAAQLAHDICLSEGGYLYVRGDETDGETLRFENRHSRAVAAVAASFDEDDFEDGADAVEVPSNLDQILNDVEVLTVPRRRDAAATTVLVQHDAAIEVPAGDTVSVYFDYRDPDSEAQFVGGQDVVTPVANTDYTADTAADGSGSDVTANCAIVATKYGSRVLLEITNSGTDTLYARGPGSTTGLQVRGRGLRRYSAVASRGVYQDSIDTFGCRQLPQPILMPYQSDQTIGQAAADYKSRIYGQLLSPRRVKPSTHAFDALAEQGILRDIGDRIAITESGTGLDAAETFIQSVEHEIRLDGQLHVWWGLAPADVTDVFIFDTGQFDVHAFGYL